MNTNLAKPLLALIVTLLMSGCLVYKIDIQQGNEVTEEMISQLEIGMTRREVTQLIGHPLITDPFHKDRWDYYYSLKDGKTGKVRDHLSTLIFADGKLQEIRSDSKDQ